MKYLLSLFFLIPYSLFAGDLKIEKAWIKAVPPTAKMSAAFGLLKNDSNKKVKLLKVSGDIAKDIEIHTHTEENGMMKMRRVAGVVIPAGGQVELKPMSYHVMLIGMRKSLKLGEQVPLTFEFDNGEKLKIGVPVQKMSYSDHKH